MKVIQAEWEKRNLGVNTIEIIFEKDDDIQLVDKQLESVRGEYLVAKVTSARNDISKLVQDYGFHFIEDIIHVEHDLHEVPRQPLHQRMYDAMTYRMMNQKDLETLYEEVEKGMFSNDRISKDPYFSDIQSATRYMNWIRDLIENGAKPYVELYRNDPAGFVILSSKDQITYTSVLGGGYEKYRSTGLGIVQKEQEIVRNLGGKRVCTSVSSNNPAQLRALMMNGYLPKEIDHVFIRHDTI